MKQRGWEEAGFEPWVYASQQASRHGYSIFNGPVESAPDPLNPYDLIVGWMVLEHLHDPVNALKKMHKWSSPSAQLVLSVPNAGALEFKLFKNGNDNNAADNQLILRVQPDEGILLKFGMKVPGAGFNIKNVGMDFHYSDLSDVYLPAAYERLLHDCMLGDSTLYARGDAVECAWSFVDPILKIWLIEKVTQAIILL